MKKKFLTLQCIAAVAIAIFVGTRSQETNASCHEFLMQNVEAVAATETMTTMSCNSQNKIVCRFSCGACKTLIKGTGVQEGTHFCSKE